MNGCHAQPTISKHSVSAFEKWLILSYQRENLKTCKFFSFQIYSPHNNNNKTHSSIDWVIDNEEEVWELDLLTGSSVGDLETVKNLLGHGLG